VATFGHESASRFYWRSAVQAAAPHFMRQIGGGSAFHALMESLFFNC
jgi:hypothetical protein